MKGKIKINDVLQHLRGQGIDVDLGSLRDAGYRDADEQLVIVRDGLRGFAGRPAANELRGSGQFGNQRETSLPPAIYDHLRGQASALAELGAQVRDLGSAIMANRQQPTPQGKGGCGCGGQPGEMPGQGGGNTLGTPGWCQFNPQQMRIVAANDVVLNGGTVAINAATAPLLAAATIMPGDIVRFSWIAAADGTARTPTSAQLAVSGYAESGNQPIPSEQLGGPQSQSGTMIFAGYALSGGGVGLTGTINCGNLGVAANGVVNITVFRRGYTYSLGQQVGS